MTISACVIAHNEEKSLPAVLSALHWVDEIIVVDCGSSDATAALARAHTGQVFTRPNLPNLNVNKNFSFDQAKSDWLLCIDADEIVSPDLSEEIRRTIQGSSVENGFFLKRKNTWFGRTLMYGGHYPDRQLRLFKRGTGRFPERHVHERLKVHGGLGELDTPLEHVPYPTLARYIEKMDFYTSFEAHHLWQGGRRFNTGSFCLALARAKFRFFRRYVLKAGFLDGWQGFAAAYLDFLSRMVIQFKLKELGEDGRI